MQFGYEKRPGNENPEGFNAVQAGLDRPTIITTGELP